MESELHNHKSRNLYFQHLEMLTTPMVVIALKMENGAIIDKLLPHTILIPYDLVKAVVSLVWIWSHGD